ncbi:MAG: peptidyl-tRNA hydrolase [Clostridium sp.]|jgi:peptidyl-tRNA hydrolase
MNILFKSNQTGVKSHEVRNNINGYLKNDIWNTDHPLFDEFKNCVQEKTYSTIDFSVFSPDIKDQVKYFVLSRIKYKGVRLYDTVIENYCKSFKMVAFFYLNTTHILVVSLS